MNLRRCGRELCWRCGIGSVWRRPKFRRGVCLSQLGTHPGAGRRSRRDGSLPPERRDQHHPHQPGHTPRDDERRDVWQLPGLQPPRFRRWWRCNRRGQLQHPTILLGGHQSQFFVTSRTGKGSADEAFVAQPERHSARGAAQRRWFGGSSQVRGHPAFRPTPHDLLEAPGTNCRGSANGLIPNRVELGTWCRGSRGARMSACRLETAG